MNCKLHSFLLVVLLAMISCQDQVGQLSGTYSYKISGVAMVDSVTRVLSDETGAMDLIRINADSALVTFNALRGPAYSTKTVLSGKQIRLLPYQRTISVGVTNYTLTASAEGTAYDNTLLMQLKYCNADSTFVADSLTLICKKNR